MAVDPERFTEPGEDLPQLDLTLAETRYLHRTLVDKETRRANMDGIRFVLGHEVEIERIDKTKLNTGLIFAITQKKFKEAEHGEDI